LLRPLAKENQNKGGELGGNPTLSAKLPKGSAIDTRKEAAKEAGKAAGVNGRYVDMARPSSP
jgi:hypothetical protein